MSFWRKWTDHDNLQIVKCFLKPLQHGLEVARFKKSHLLYNKLRSILFDPLLKKNNQRKTAQTSCTNCETLDILTPSSHWVDHELFCVVKHCKMQKCPAAKVCKN